MANTYSVRTEIMPDCVEKGILAIYNSNGSGRYIDIKKIYCNNLNISPPSPYIGLERMSIITSGTLTGGTDITANATKFNSSATDPSSLCTIKKGAVISTGTHELLRRIISCPTFNSQRALASMTARRAGGMTRDNLSFRDIYSGAYSNVSFEAMQPVTLNEDEILVWYVYTRPYSNYYRFSCMFQIGTDIYVIDDLYNTDTEQDIASFSIQNDTAAPIKIIKFCVTEAGDDTNPIFAIVPIKGIKNGTTLTPVKHDSASETLPAGILIKENAEVEHAIPKQFPNYGDTYFAVISEIPMTCQRAFLFPKYKTIRPMANFKYQAGTMCKLESAGVRWDSMAENITLREGDGVAVIPMCEDYTSTAQENTLSSRGQRAWNILFTATVTPPEGWAA